MSISPEEKLIYIKACLEAYKNIDITIPDVNIVYDILKGGSEEIKYSLFIGIYYRLFRWKAESYFIKAINEGDADAMVIYGRVCELENDYVKAEEYYLMGVEKGHISSEFLLGNLYRHLQHLNEAEKFYLKALRRGNTKVFNEYGYLFDIRGDVVNAKKYYLLGVGVGCTFAMENYGHLFYVSRKYDIAEEYYNMAIERGGVKCFYEMICILGKKCRSFKTLEIYRKYFRITKNRQFLDEAKTLLSQINVCSVFELMDEIENSKREKEMCEKQLNELKEMCAKQLSESKEQNPIILKIQVTDIPAEVLADPVQISDDYEFIEKKSTSQL